MIHLAGVPASCPTEDSVEGRMRTQGKEAEASGTNFFYFKLNAESKVTI